MAAYLKTKDEPAALAASFVEFNRDARNKGLQNALIAVGVIGLSGFVVACFLPGGKAKKTAAADAAAPRADAGPAAPPAGAGAAAPPAT
jgi:hypothetical protein